MKKNKIVYSAILFSLLFGCSGNKPSSEQSNNSGTNYKEKPTIFLAGDSTVKTYQEKQFIGGWGQYLDLFVNENITIKNCSQGGRSSRSFINEGRLYVNEDSSYTFSENDGKAISEEIEAGDFLMIQFGHNDDDTKTNFSNMYNRFVPLGEKDANGIYPTTPATKMPTTHLPEAYLNNVNESEKNKAYTEIAKYGSSYYAYDSGGTYKWYLKQYIDFARSKKAIPVLVTPVPRIKFVDNKIVGGPGLHGEDFAYVQAVRQLADEEDCLLIDLFKDVKEILECATSSYANYLMALKPNDLEGDWPTTYDKSFSNVEMGCTGIEATHYNKYGAFISAAKVAEAFIKDKSKHNNDTEDYYFVQNVLKTPEKYIDPSNLISKSKVAEIEALFKEVTVTNPSRTYKDPADVVALINTLQGEVTQENYLEFKTKCDEILKAYYELNIDDRALVTNYNVLLDYIAKVDALIEANRPKPIKTTVYDFDDASLGIINSTINYKGVKIVATEAKTMSYKASAVTFSFNGNSYSYGGGLSLGGSASFGTARYVEFEVEANCTITVVAKSSSSSMDRTLSLANETNSVIGAFDAKSALSISSIEVEKGLYKVGSSGSGAYLYAIIIDYYA